MALGDEKPPSPGDRTLCIHCHHLCVFSDDMTLRNPTDKEMIEVAGDRRLLMALEILSGAKRAWKETTGKEWDDE